jgi:hypothetical protein
VTAPEALHADLIARLGGVNDHLERHALGVKLDVIEEAIAALGDTVPREQYDAVLTDRNSHKENVGELLVRSLDAERERDEARAERDALAHVIEQGDHAEDCNLGRWCTCYKSKPPAVSLALHDAEVWDACLDAIEQNELNTEQARQGNPYRAAAIREEADRD